MKAQNFNLKKYLGRTGFLGLPKVDTDTLKNLMRAQVRSVPFENITVQQGQIPSLIPEDIYIKIVENRRGGYCYEVNSLFAMALTELGYDWYFAAAKPMFYSIRRPRTHIVVIVKLAGEKWLCDTGFGGYGLREPIALQDYTEVTQSRDHYRIEKNNDEEYILSLNSEGEWKNQYGFMDQPQDWIEFSLANHFNTTHPDTIFTQKKLAVIQTQTGRRIIVNDIIKII
jgi:N-hydroxyarylamine O-acetyltransferase